MIAPRARRLPAINPIRTSSSDDAFRSKNMMCPDCQVTTMVWDGYKINDWFCSICGLEMRDYEQKKQRYQQEQLQLAQQQQPLPTPTIETDDNNDNMQPIDEGFIATIDGYIDSPNAPKLNTTAKFRPVEGSRAVNRYDTGQKWTSQTAKELEARGLIITSSKEFLEDSGDTFVSDPSGRSRRYDPRIR